MARLARSKWLVPGACALIGAAFALAQWRGGNARDGLYALLFMLVLGLALLLGGRNATGRALRGDARDERFRAIDTRAGALTGLVLILTLVLLALTRLARGETLDPYGELLAVAAVAYIAALALLHWRG